MAAGAYCSQPMKISVISPTSGPRLHFLKECIASVGSSVLAGVEAEFEHVILVQGPNQEEALKYLEQEAPPFVKHLSHPQPLPPGQARNLAIEAASGDWLAVLDDDDLMLQRTLFYFARAAQQNPKTRWFISDFLRVNEQLAYQPADDYYGWQFDSVEQMLQAFFKSESFVQGNVFFNKGLFYEVGQYDQVRRTAEDLELYTRFLLADALPLCLPIVSHLHRVHTQNTSKGIGRDHHYTDLTHIYDKLKQPLKAKGIKLELGEFEMVNQ